MRVEVQHDGDDAVGLMEDVLAGRRRVDLILMDMYMKRMSGVEAVGKIREMQAARGAPTVPIIAMTGGGVGSGGKSDNEVVFRSGMQGVIIKPLNIRAFPGALAQCMYHFGERKVEVDMGKRMEEGARFRQVMLDDIIVLESA